MRSRDFSAGGRATRRGICAGGPRIRLTTSPQHRDSPFRACAAIRWLFPPAERDTPGSLGASMRSSTSSVLAGMADLFVMAQADFRGKAGVSLWQEQGEEKRADAQAMARWSVPGVTSPRMRRWSRCGQAPRRAAQQAAVARASHRLAVYTVAVRKSQARTRERTSVGLTGLVR